MKRHSAAFISTFLQGHVRYCKKIYILIKQQRYGNCLKKDLNVLFVLFPGWQPRWFVLDGGTLSYYDSQEDAWKGCKGSIKISVCEIQGLCDSRCAVSVVTELWTCFFFFDKHVSLFCCCVFHSSFLWLHTSRSDHTRRAVLLPQSHQCSWEAEMAGCTGNGQSLPYGQPDKERKRYLDAITSWIYTVKVFPKHRLIRCLLLQSSRRTQRHWKRRCPNSDCTVTYFYNK